MNLFTVLFTVLLGFVQFSQCESISTNYNNLRMRNFGLRLIVFKEKQIQKILMGLQKTAKIYYNSLLVCTAEGINSYNELSEDDRILIETVIALCY